jgi:hypothetical protein
LPPAAFGKATRGTDAIDTVAGGLTGPKGQVSLDHPREAGIIKPIRAWQPGNHAASFYRAQPRGRV